MTTAEIPKLIGARVKRREDPRLITGNATYVDDVRLPEMLHMAVLRSPFAHARIVSLDVSRAKALAGVTEVITGREIKALSGPVPTASTLPGLKVPERWPLAIDEVRHAGEAVAAVAASDPYVARDALDLIDVQYEPLPAVAGVEKAVAADAPRVHNQFDSNVAYTWSLSSGDAEQGLKDAEVSVSQRMVEQRLAPVSMETRGAVASYNAGDESLTVWTSTQIPHLAKTILGGMVNVPEQKMRVIAPEVGGGFGSKLNVYAEEALAAALSIKTHRPVKWIETRSEAMRATIHGRDQVAYVDIGAKRDGTLTAYRVRILGGLGAYHQLLTANIPTLTGLMISGSYKIPNMLVEIQGVFTNTTPTDAYRGAGRPEATYYIERAMDLLAAKLDMDPIELRRKNFPKPSEFPFAAPTGLTYDSGDYEKTLDRALEMAGYQDLRRRQEEERRAKSNTLIGVGLSTYVEICGFGPSAALPAGGWETSMVRVERGGSVTVHTGTSPHGQGQETSFAQIVAQELGVPIDNVVVLHGDTSIVTQGIGTFGSRAMAVGGEAVMMSVRKVQDKAKRLAAHLLEATAGDVVYENGRVALRGAPEHSVSLGEIAQAAYNATNLPPGEEPGLQATSFFEPSNFTFPFGAHIAVVEIDKETGQIRLARYIAVDDCGSVVNPLLVRGQLHGGLAQGIAQALYEEVVYDENGELRTGSLMDYALPTAESFPRFELDRTETPTPVNSLGAKGVGEAGTIGSSPAIVNAVVDALKPFGVTHIDMMLRPEKIWNIIAQGEKA